MPDDRIVNDVPIYYFRTYVGAASKAFQAGYITNEGLLRVIEQAKIDILRIEEKYSLQDENLNKKKIDNNIKYSRNYELEKDIIFAESLITSNNNTI